MMGNTIVSVGTCSLYFVLLACLGRIYGFRDLVPWYELQGWFKCQSDIHSLQQNWNATQISCVCHKSDTCLSVVTETRGRFYDVLQVRYKKVIILFRKETLFFG